MHIYRVLVVPCLGAVALCAMPAMAIAQGGAPASPPTAMASQSALAAAQPLAPVPTKLPIFNRANERLPSWLRVRGELRQRFEGFDSIGFVGGRNDHYSLSRVRLNATVTASKQLSFQVNVHDARMSGKTIGSLAAPFRGPFDVRTAFADVGSAKSPVALRLGRQELAFGEQRLVGHLAWVNTGRSFDAARATLRAKPMQVDVFAASVLRNLPDVWDRSGNGNRFYGAYGSSTTLLPKGTVEPYVFFRQDRNVASELGGTGRLNQATVGIRLAGKLPAALDYGVETALQRGSVARDSISAWAGHYQIRESLPVRWAVKLISEYNYASGDADRRDGTRGTFDQLYPTGHDKLGLSDQVGWKNVHHVREGVEFTPVKGTPISVSYHSWWLANRADALYGANSAVVARVVGGAASSHVGHEIDVQASRALTPYLALVGGYAHMLPGAFLKQATPGAAFRAPYLMATYTVLADK